MTQAQRDMQKKLRILDHADQAGNVSKTCRYFGISHDTFDPWKRNLKERGEEGLINGKPCPQNIVLRTPSPIAEQILYLRKRYHLDQVRISWYLQRYHEIRISPAGVYCVLKRNGLNRLPRNAQKRTVQTTR